MISVSSVRQMQQYSANLQMGNKRTKKIGRGRAQERHWWLIRTRILAFSLHGKGQGEGYILSMGCGHYGTYLQGCLKVHPTPFPLAKAEKRHGGSWTGMWTLGREGVLLSVHLPSETYRGPPAGACPAIPWAHRPTGSTAQVVGSRCPFLGRDAGPVAKGRDHPARLAGASASEPPQVCTSLPTHS